MPSHFSSPLFIGGIPTFGGGGGIPAMFGDVRFVDYTNGSDGYYGLSKSRPLKTLSKAEDLSTTGKNDLILINGVDPVQEDTMITWDKNKIHVIGMGIFGATDQEPRIIFTTAGIAAEVAALLKVTGWGNSFTNIRVNNWTTYASARAALWDAGEGTVYTNSQFNMFGLLATTTVSDVEARGDSTTWRHVKFGADTLVKSVRRHVMLIKGTGGSARMKNNVFEDCYYYTRTDTNTISFIKVFDTNSLAFNNIWRNPVMMSPVITSSGDVQLLNAVEAVSGLAEGEMLFDNPITNAASFCDSGSANDRIKVIGPGITAGTTNIGVAVQPT